MVRGERGLVLIALGCSLVWLLLPAGFALAGYNGAARAALVVFAVALTVIFLVVALLRMLYRAALRAFPRDQWEALDVRTRAQLERSVMAGRPSPVPELAHLAAGRARQLRGIFLGSAIGCVAVAAESLFDLLRGFRGWRAPILGLVYGAFSAGAVFMIWRLRRSERLNRALARDAERDQAR